MQRGPRQTHAGWRETQGLQAGNKGTGCSGRAAGPPCSPAPHHALPIYRVPPRPCCALPLGSEGKRRVQESGKMRRGHILNTIPALQDLTLAAGGFVAEPEAQGRLFITAPPQPAPGWTRDVQPQCRWLLSKHQPLDPGRRVSGLCQTSTHGIWSRQPLPTPPL